MFKLKRKRKKDIFSSLILVFNHLTFVDNSDERIYQSIYSCQQNRFLFSYLFADII